MPVPLNAPIVENVETPALRALTDRLKAQAKNVLQRGEEPQVVVSPYRFNPIGAHVDHQGGQVLARTLDQYTLLCFWPTDDCRVTLHSTLEQVAPEPLSFVPGELGGTGSWEQMARATAAALADHAPLVHGIEGLVHGTLISGGLSSSASVILAYLKALALVNRIDLDALLMVELCRRVENDYRGLNNGIQDQMSIAFACRDSLSRLDMNAVSSRTISDPENIDQVQFLLLYSGISRDLAGSGFNTRVSECQQAAALLHPGARHLGEVPVSGRSSQALARLPDLLSRRARHVYSETARVDAGVDAWTTGDLLGFGRLMNASCKSSIECYESGSEWLICLQELAQETQGVLGSRFSGGGYGGCLVMLVDAEAVDRVSTQMLERYLMHYPDLAEQARVMPAVSEGTVRLL